MMDELFGFLVFVAFLALAVGLIWQAYTYTMSLEDSMERVAEGCLEAYYNNTQPQGYTCEVYGKLLGGG